MHVTVICAGGSGMSASSDVEIIIPKNATEDAVVEAFGKVSYPPFQGLRP